MQNKTFRLFISSTFNDFRREREILQTKVFPYIKEYALKAGYTFQPIDLRWGVSNEAQLDQKTLELCLEEVRACKTHIHPNFLIMIGDRYGWIPLPYVIEVKEFEELLLLVNDNEKQQLLEWYIKDLNQLPPSYILKERVGEYENFDTWNKIEINLHDILQSAVNKSNLNEEQKRKYLLSATEAEVEEGIIPYINPTKFQRDELLSKKENKDLETVDPEHIFGFFRDVDNDTKIEDKFIDDDYAKAQLFKERVDNVLLDDNVLHVKTKQIDKETLEENYLAEFEKRMIKFLESQVEMQKTQETKDRLTPLQIEIKAQSVFAEQKRRDFIETKELELLLSTVSNYISGMDQEPLVIYGPSGRGKSSLMAQAIEHVKDKNPLYRFVGATPNSGSSKEILTSLFAELGIDIRSKQDTRDETLLNTDEKQETFEQFSERIYAEFTNIKQETVIFIDAVDQLENVDQFLWLPRQLPLNVKIIISALDDKKYKDDSKYFKTLKSKTDSLYEIPVFSEPKQLLYVLLEKENRTLQKDQEDYFLQQFQTANSPLYVSIAAQELKNWKSSDYVEGNSLNKKGKKQDLKPTQKGIIHEFIVNLSKIYYHNEEFVTKVLGYLYASKDGLSESELLQLISVDEAFVKKMAPETWHENPNKELPLIHWSRLHTQLKAFLKTQGPEELMYFFHREFEDVIKELQTVCFEHEAITEATQNLIIKHQKEDFNSNRWGRLYITLITEYQFRYGDEELRNKYAFFLVDTKRLQKNWISNCLSVINSMGREHDIYKRVTKAMSFHTYHYLSSKQLYEENSKHWVKQYMLALNNLALSYADYENPNEAIRLLEESLNIRKSLYKTDSKRWIKDYTIALNNLAYQYKYVGRSNEAIRLEEESLNILKIQYIANHKRFVYRYLWALRNLADSYFKHEDKRTEAIEMQEESLHIVELLYKETPSQWARIYIDDLNIIALHYRETGKMNEAVMLVEKGLNITRKLYEVNQDKWIQTYVTCLNALSTLYRDVGNVSEVNELENEMLNLLKVLYKLN